MFGTILEALDHIDTFFIGKKSIKQAIMTTIKSQKDKWELPYQSVVQIRFSFDHFTVDVVFKTVDDYKNNIYYHYVYLWIPNEQIWIINTELSLGPYFEEPLLPVVDDTIYHVTLSISEKVEKVNQDRRNGLIFKSPFKAFGYINSVFYGEIGQAYKILTQIRLLNEGLKYQEILKIDLFVKPPPVSADIFSKIILPDNTTTYRLDLCTWDNEKGLWFFDREINEDFAPKSKSSIEKNYTTIFFAEN